jgi:hypothetical protein
VIEAIAQWKGPSSAKVICDLCLHHETVTCGYQRRGAAKSEPNEGQCIQRVTSNGWSFVKKILRCPKCEAARKKGAAKPKWLKDAETQVKKEAKVTTTKESKPALRQPTPDQELDIIEALLTCYDRKAKRYSGADTDKTVAESIGGGVLPGWVAAIREAKFGPSGGNEEIEKIRAEIADIVSKAAATREADRAAADKRHAETIEAARALEKRIDAVCVAVGPKARGA